MNSPKKIMVIDDDDGIRDAFNIMLETRGYQVITTKNSETLKLLTKNNLPDLIFLDILWSGQDGREVCKSLKKNDLTKNIPVIMISAHPNAEKTIAQYGADGFLAKPFEMDHLFNKVSIILGESKK